MATPPPTLPPYPVRGDGQTVFSERAEAWNAAMKDDVVPYFYTASVEAEAASSIATTAAQNAANSAFNLGPHVDDDAADAWALSLSIADKTGYTYTNTTSDKARMWIDGAWEDLDADASASAVAADMSAQAAAVHATSAENAAATAEAIAGPTYSSTTDGLAATSYGQTFAVNNGGIVTVYLNNGGVAVAQREIATSASFFAINSARAQPMWNKIRAGQLDVQILVISDSTGNQTTEWPYLMAQWLATLAPTHSVSYRNCTEDAVFAWNAPVVISTGTGARTIYVDCAAAAGTTDLYCDGGNASRIYDSRKIYDVVILNHGHNYGTGNSANFLSGLFTRAAAAAMHYNPVAQLFITLQNPNMNVPAYSQQAVQAWRGVAARLGLGIIDAYDKFMAQANPEDWLAGDKLHPNAAGSLELWLPAVQEALAENRNFGFDPGAQLSPLTTIRPNLVSNPVFAQWEAGAADPDSWTRVNITVSKDVGRSSGQNIYALKISPTGNNPRLQQSLSTMRTLLRGRVVTAFARVWIPAGLTSDAARVGVSTNNGSVTNSVTSASTGYARDGWLDIMSQPLCIQPDATSITVSLFCGRTDGSDTGKEFWVESIGLVFGDLPAAIDFASQPAGVIEQYYSDQSVINSGVGTTTAVAGTITHVGSNPGFARAYFAFPTVPGRTYRASWNQTSITGGGAPVTVYARPSATATGSDLASVNGSSGALTFTATSTVTSLLISGGSNVTGWVHTDWSVIDVYNGLDGQLSLPLTSGRNIDGSVVDATGGAGKFSATLTAGTSLSLAGEAAQGNTKTDAVAFETTLPTSYIAGKPLTLTINAQLSGSGTAGTKTLQPTAYLIAADGSHGANIGPAAQNLDASATDMAFAITSTGLSPGDRLLIVLEAVVEETGGSDPLNAAINSARLS